MKFKQYFLANFVECDDPDRLWIGEIISAGEDNLKSWMKRSQTMSYMFKTEVEVFVSKENFSTTVLYQGTVTP